MAILVEQETECFQVLLKTFSCYVLLLLDALYLTAHQYHPELVQANELGPRLPLGGTYLLDAFEMQWLLLSDK